MITSSRTLWAKGRFRGIVMRTDLGMRDIPWRLGRQATSVVEVGPGGVFVVGGVGLEAAVEDSDESVGELA